MHGVERGPGHQLTKTSLITAIPHHQRRIICSQLDVFDKWKRFVGFIKGRDGSPRYTDLHMCLFDKEKERRHGSPTEAVLNDWRTLRPTIGDFIDVLQTVDLIATADYIHNDVLKLGPLREPVQHSEREDGGLHLSVMQQPQSDIQTLGSFGVYRDLPSPLSYQEHTNPSILDFETMESLKVLVSQRPDPIPFYPYHELEIYTNDFDKVHLHDGGRFLGKGGYGEVYLGKAMIDNNIEMLAVKRFHESSLEYLKQFKTELGVIFMNCRHPNLLAIKGICHERSFCVVYEYMAEGTLEQKLKSDLDRSTAHLNSERRLQIAIDIARGISRLHNGDEHPIVHRDIKPANILLDCSLNAKVGDYGLVRVQTLQDNSHTNKTTDVHGSSDYMPPEAFQGIVSPKWDVYSFGVVLLELLFAKGPVHRDADGFPEKMIEFIFGDDYEGDPLSLLDPKCDWNRDVAIQILKLVEKCALKWRRRLNISGDDDAVLETLLKIQEDVKRLSR